MHTFSPTYLLACTHARMHACTGAGNRREANVPLRIQGERMPLPVPRHSTCTPPPPPTFFFEPPYIQERNRLSKFACICA
jgi:hypothetical protein